MQNAINKRPLGLPSLNNPVQRPRRKSFEDVFESIEIKALCTQDPCTHML